MTHLMKNRIIPKQQLVRFFLWKRLKSVGKNYVSKVVNFHQCKNLHRECFILVCCLNYEVWRQVVWWRLRFALLGLFLANENTSLVASSALEEDWWERFHVFEACGLSSWLARPFVVWEMSLLRRSRGDLVELVFLMMKSEICAHTFKFSSAGDFSCFIEKSELCNLIEKGAANCVIVFVVVCGIR